MNNESTLENSINSIITERIEIWSKYCMGFLKRIYKKCTRDMQNTTGVYIYSRDIP